MPLDNRIVLWGYGRIGRFVYSGLVNSESKPLNSDINFEQLTKAIFSEKGLSLTDIYKKVQHKYFPEKDCYKFNNK